jgi:hypothetical protein
VSDAQQYIGKIHDIGLPRDAVHIAVVQVTAEYAIKAGEHVGITKEGKVSLGEDVLIGIVDPFLKEVVLPGERFYLFLYPRSYYWKSSN